MTHTLDFPVSPLWIHDVLHLWQPDQPVSDLVNAALNETMQELGGEKTRRNSLSIILRTFVPTTGSGKLRRTTAENLWASASRSYSAETLGPAYLAQLIVHNEGAAAIASTLAARYKVGDRLAASDVRRLLSARYGQRKVVLNSASAFLRSLVFFGVLESTSGEGKYVWTRALAVAEGVFLLLVWSWWQHDPAPQVNLDAFDGHPCFAFIQTGSFAGYWRAYGGRLWSIEERLETRRATLRYASLHDFSQAVNTLLSQQTD